MGEPTARRGNSKKSSPVANGNGEANSGSNGATTETTISRRPSTRVKNVVDYDEKRAYVNLSEDTIPPEHRKDVIESGIEQRVNANNDLDDAWETDSFFADLLEEMTDEKFIAEDPDACTPGEAAKYQQLLREVGPEVLVQRTVQSGLITAKKLLTAFGIRAPACFEGADDSAYYPLLSLALTRELSKRAKLSKYNSIDDAVALLNRSKNIIVLTGAGISTSLGIPDFRSKGMGLYSKLTHLGLNDPQEVFDIRVFRQDPTIFFSVARDILPSTERFSPTHAFIALLQDKDKLLTNYSQNIDNLEAKAGVRPDKLVQCHGSFATATCFKCGHKVVGETLFPEIRAGKIPRCKKCAQTSRTASNSATNGSGSGNNSRKRKLNKDGTEKKVRRRPGHYDSNSDSEFDQQPVSGHSGCGVMKPDITFFGEPLPDEFSRRLTQHDRDKVDLVIVIGTSLKVAPVSEVVPYLPSHIPQICISRDPITHINFDIDLLGDCDIVVAELCRRAGWDLPHEMIPEGQVVEVLPVPGYKYQHRFVQVQPPMEPAATSPGLAHFGDDDSSELSSSVSVSEEEEEEEVGDSGSGSGSGNVGVKTESVSVSSGSEKGKKNESRKKSPASVKKVDKEEK